MPLVGKTAPDFTCKAVVGSDFQDYTLSNNWKGRSPKYTLLFFYPLDFTFVCPTEIIAFSDRIKEFEARDVQVVGVSVDSEYSHLAWKETPRVKGGLGDIAYPLVADMKKQISAAYDVLARWLNSESTDTPTTCTSRDSNSRMRSENAMISVGQTKVKSLG